MDDKARVGTPDSDEAREEQKGQKDPNFMPRQLHDWLNAGDFNKALKFTSAKLSRGSKTSMFFAVITAYCLLRTGKQSECLDVLADYKAQKPTDSWTAKYLVAIYNNLGRYADATATLEYVLTLFPGKRDLSE